MNPKGVDPYLEDVRTLWLLHWKISTIVADPLFAWEFLLNKWQHPEITRSDVIAAFTQEASRLDRKLSAVTLEQHSILSPHLLSNAKLKERCS